MVEAYWIGNSLLENISQHTYLAFLNELLCFRQKTDSKNYQLTGEKILTYAIHPHHSFHVFNIFKQHAKRFAPPVTHTMDQCRIGWGKIVNKDPLLVQTKPLVVKNRTLILGEPIIKEIKLDYQGKRFIRKTSGKSWISFHWGFACDIFTKQQVQNLEYYTQKSIDFFNSP